MNYYPHAAPFCAEPQNRFIYVKQDFVPAAAPKVLVNPHFKQKVYVNPLFKPKIHVNPSFVQNVATAEEQKPEYKTVIATRTKLVRIPENTKLERKRRTSLHTKYKIVRSNSSNSSQSSSSFVVRDKFKLDKRVQKTGSQISKKKYVYVNRFLSISVAAKNVLIKQNSNLWKPGFVNINGILYKKSPNFLRKAGESASNSFVKSSKHKIVRKQSLVKKRSSGDNRRASLVKRFKIIRSKKVVKNKLRKCNIPCPVFRKFGKCKGKDNGTCFKLHNPDQIVLCTRFLQGACHDKSCLLSHKVSPEKMPTCKYFLEGLCSRDDCPYLHVKISAKAEICRDFLEGFCKKGAECDKRHQLLCPEFEKTGACPKRRCPYPHGGGRVRKLIKKRVSSSRMVAKKCSRVRVEKEAVAGGAEGANRYYLEKAKEGGQERRVVGAVTKSSRPKLGQLPAFIPLLDGSSSCCDDEENSCA